MALVAFVTREARVAHPLLPLHIVTDRSRGGAYLAMGLSTMAMFGQFLLLTYYFQITLGYSPLQAGLAFLPLTASLVVGSTQIGARLLHRARPRRVMASGYLLAGVGFVWVTTLTADASYLQVLPGTLLLGLGTGTAGVAATTVGTSGVTPGDAGIASAMVNTSQQIGGAIGTALLASVAASVTAGLPASPEATMQGYTTAFWVAAACMVLAALTSLFVRSSRPVTTTAATPATAH